jgi:hypothetical protein
VTLLLILFCFSANAQLTAGKDSASNLHKNLFDTGTIRRNTIFIELGGDAPLYSINYDRIIRLKKSPLDISISIGIGSAGPGTEEYIPMEFNLLTAKKENHFEIGFGFSPSFTHSSDNLIFGRIGFRHQPKKYGAFFRADFTPVYQYNYSSKFCINLWAGLSTGASF